MSLMDDRDLSFEALAEVCGIDWQTMNKNTRGKLNVALRLIRESSPGLTDDELALVIPEKAKSYRLAFDEAALTPTGLANQWDLLDAVRARAEEPTQQVNASARPTYCRRCQGSRFILVAYRPVVPSIWAVEHRSKKHPHLGEPDPNHRGPEDGFEEWGPCPDCNQTGVNVVERHFALKRANA